MNTLKAEKRDMTTKAKKLRREGYVTGVIYGREMKESIPLQMEKPAVERILKTNGKGSQVMLEVGGETYDALIKEIDYDSLKGQLLEIDFQALVSNEKVHSVAEIILLNHEAVQAGVVQQMLQEVSYKALPAACRCAPPAPGCPARCRDPSGIPDRARSPKPLLPAPPPDIRRNPPEAEPGGNFSG